MLDNTLFVAHTPAQLVDSIALVEVVVQPRHEGREKWKVEQWAIHRLLRALPKGRFSYPVILTRTERPDYLLSIAGHVIGIEHTEAVSQVQAKIDFEQGKMAAAGGNVPSVRMMDARSPDDAPLTKAEAQQYIAHGTPFVGGELEENWLHAMQHFISNKAEKYATYQPCDTKAVLVYDNWPTIGLDVPKAAALLHLWLKDSDTFRQIDALFILRHDTIINATASGLRFINP